MPIRGLLISREVVGATIWQVVYHDPKDLWDQLKPILTTHPSTVAKSLDPKVNPLMYDWNSVEVRYCDGASVSGDKVTPTVVGNTTLHFRGRAILDAGIKSLLDER